MRVNRFLRAAAVLALLWCCPVQADQGDIDDRIDLATTPAPQGENGPAEWWAERHAAKLAERRPGVELVLIGDSITHWWEEAGAPVWARHFGDIEALNLGYAADRTEHVLWRLDHGEVDGLAPDLVVIMIGTNNTGHRMDPPAAIAAGVARILDEVQARLPAAEVLLLAIFPRGETADDPMRVNNRASNLRLQKLAADRGVQYADFNAPYLEPDGRLKIDLMPDLLHPNEAGYEIWAGQLAPWFARYLDG